MLAVDRSSIDALRRDDARAFAGLVHVPTPSIPFANTRTKGFTDRPVLSKIARGGAITRTKRRPESPFVDAWPSLFVVFFRTACTSRHIPLWIFLIGLPIRFPLAPRFGAPRIL